MRMTQYDRDLLQHEPGNQVTIDAHNVCPRCGEDRLDYLATDYDARDFIKCLSCGKMYTVK